MLEDGVSRRLPYHPRRARRGEIFAMRRGRRKKLLEMKISNDESRRGDEETYRIPQRRRRRRQRHQHAEGKSGAPRSSVRAATAMVTIHDESDAAPALRREAGDRRVRDVRPRYPRFCEHKRISNGNAEAKAGGELTKGKEDPAPRRSSSRRRSARSAARRARSNSAHSHMQDEAASTKNPESYGVRRDPGRWRHSASSVCVRYEHLVVSVRRYTSPGRAALKADEWSAENRNNKRRVDIPLHPFIRDAASRR